MCFLAVINEEYRKFGGIDNLFYLIFPIVSIQAAFEIETVGFIYD